MSRQQTNAALEASRCIELLQFQLNLFQRHTLALFTFCPLVSEYIKNLASRIVSYFVRQAALIRPMSDNGKLQLAGDLAQLELALNPLYQLHVCLK
jgi:hypothetical protein